MNIDEIAIALFTVFGIVFTYWFFLMKKDEVVAVQDSVDITVKGGYTPSTIQIPNGKSTKISFLRTDTSSCLEEVVISNFKIKKYLPLNEKITVTLTPHDEGVYVFSCGMNMYHGKIIVRDQAN